MTDASKKVTPSGLVLLGWQSTAGVWIHRESEMCWNMNGGQWTVGRYTIHPRLAPRTLAEVKFLMDRMMEDD